MVGQLDNSAMTMLATTFGLSWIALSSVFRCDLPGEPVLFSDRPCRNAVIVELKEVPMLQSIALTDSELSAILGDERPSPADQSRTRLQPAKPGASRSQACAEARADLRSVQMRRRKGYSLAEGVQLEGQAQKHKDTIRANC